jgi:hypothetical protein
MVSAGSVSIPARGMGMQHVPHVSLLPMTLIEDAGQPQKRCSSFTAETLLAQLLALSLTHA